MHTISRDELYEQVWSKPMTKVAAEYGVTSTALKKTCNRHKIPTPGRGYWAKLEHDKPVRRASLPKLTDARLDQVRISGTSAPNLPEQVSKAGMEARERLAGASELAPAGVTDFPVEEPPILGATRRAISKARPDAAGFTNVQGRGMVFMKIAPGSSSGPAYCERRQPPSTAPLASHWRDNAGTPPPPRARDLGENITTNGLDLERMPLGTLIELGPAAIVELTGLRTPCVLIDRFQAEPKRHVLSSAATGPPFKSGVLGVVRAGGAVAAGDSARARLPSYRPYREPLPWPENLPCLIGCSPCWPR